MPTDLSDNEKISLVMSIGVVLLSIFAVIAFFLYNQNLIPFYIIAALAIVLGFYLAYRLSKEKTEQKPKKQRSSS
ncbi:MAG: hypothetical protein M1122_00125 [Candidatus Marsarchaeota archaeon]|jgi:uncharacterized membrane protein YfcA|nr:hypothetical protein [Candidatus Marsarchaeota archaeon]